MPTDAPHQFQCPDVVTDAQEADVVIEIPTPPIPLPVALEQPIRTLNTVEIYDPSTRSWSEVASMRHTRADHEAALLTDGRVLVVGGVDDHSTLPYAEVYDPATNAWTQLPPLATNRVEHRLVVLRDGRVLVIGGMDDHVAVGLVEVWDPNE